MINHTEKVDCGAFVSEKFWHHFWQKTFSGDYNHYHLDTWSGRRCWLLSRDCFLSCFRAGAAATSVAGFP